MATQVQTLGAILDDQGNRTEAWYEWDDVALQVTAVLARGTARQSIAVTLTDPDTMQQWRRVVSIDAGETRFTVRGQKPSVTLDPENGAPILPFLVSLGAA